MNTCAVIYLSIIFLSGLGRATAEEMAKRGGKVVMGCRNLEKCERVKKEIIEATLNKNIHCRHLDLASLESVHSFAESVNANERRVDVLINNAGVMGIRERQKTQDGFEMHLGVNYLGHFLLTHLLLDKLKVSAPSRIINITAAIYETASINFDDLNAAKKYSYDVAYAQSKLALVLFNHKMAQILKDTKVSTYVVYPGLCKTNLGRNLSMNKSVISGNLVKPLLNITMKNVDQGIQTILMCALSPEVAEESGHYYKGCHMAPVREVGKDQAVADRLYAISRVWTGLGLEQNAKK
jgi:retinol dehydrogenase-13